MNRTTPMLPEHDIRETPPDLFEALDKEFHFDLDACATHENTKCPLYFTEQGLWAQPVLDGLWVKGADASRISDQDGLTGSWEGRRAWCNPPYSDIGAWVAKAWQSRASLVVMLVPATRTEQGWWQDLVEPQRDGGPGTLSTRFLPGRVHFLENGQPILRKNADGTLWRDTRGRTQRSSPKFGCALLIWRSLGGHDAKRNSV